jgi:gamma-glutamyl hydrolase
MREDIVIDHIIGNSNRFDLNYSYLVASYVKFVESAGGRAAVIPYDASKEHLKKLFDSVNGLLFTGGGLDLVSGEPYFETMKYLWDLMVEANARGDYFPFWGTALFYELTSRNMPRFSSISCTRSRTRY